MKDTYVYRIGENLYVNLTNRCTNRCVFCVRNGKETYEGHALWLRGAEPTAEQVIGELGGEDCREVVFCGFGEPTFRLTEMLAVCGYVHSAGKKTRLNTNGHGSAINGKDIAPLLSGALDGVNISLNAPTREEYEALCRPQIGGAFEATLGFARSCKQNGVNCWFSVVDVIGGEKIALCRALAEEVGIPLRVREYIP